MADFANRFEIANFQRNDNLNGVNFILRKKSDILNGVCKKVYRRTG